MRLRRRRLRLGACRPAVGAGALSLAVRCPRADDRPQGPRAGSARRPLGLDSRTLPASGSFPADPYSPCMTPPDPPLKTEHNSARTSKGTTLHLNVPPQRRGSVLCSPGHCHARQATPGIRRPDSAGNSRHPEPRLPPASCPRLSFSFSFRVRLCPAWAGFFRVLFPSTHSNPA